MLQLSLREDFSLLTPLLVDPAHSLFLAAVPCPGGPVSPVQIVQVRGSDCLLDGSLDSLLAQHAHEAVLASSGHPSTFVGFVTPLVRVSLHVDLAGRRELGS